MKQFTWLAFTLLITIAFTTKATAQQKIDPVIETKVDVLTFSDKMRDAVVNYKVGSILTTPGANRSFLMLMLCVLMLRMKLPLTGMHRSFIWQMR
jgi:hypothetical protein